MTIRKVMDYLTKFNDCGFVHCNIIIINYGESMLKGGCARAGHGHYKYSASETMLKPGTSIYDTVTYSENVDCFAVGVMAWELATGGHAFPNTEATSSLVVADMNVLYYNKNVIS
jgi:hypothetical protein